MNREDTIQKIEKGKIMAIVRGILGRDCLNLAKALYDGGVTLLEATFDPNNAAEREKTAATIRLLNEELGDKMTFGAGTVTTVEMVMQAKNAGAQFIVSPNTDEKVIRATVENDMVSIPGAFSPTEIKYAHDCGGDFIKVFPACDLGVSYFKNVHAPLSDCKLLAVGGVNEKNITDYFAAGVVGVGVASCLFKKDWVAAGEWQKIIDATHNVMSIIGK